MPIYAYKCSACGYARDVLQKMSDPLLTVCPECGADTFVKQLTAAGFQLKGSGWYATDFKGGNAPALAKGDGEGGDKPAASSSDASADTASKSDSGKPDKSAAPSALPAASAAPSVPAASPVASSAGTASSSAKPGKATKAD